MSEEETLVSVPLDPQEQVWLSRLEDTVLGEPEGRVIVVDENDSYALRKLPKDRFDPCLPQEDGRIGVLRLKGREQIICSRKEVGRGWVHVETPGVFGRKLVQIATVTLRGTSMQKRLC